MRLKSFLISSSLLLLAAACDEGDIHPSQGSGGGSDGVTVAMTADISGAGDFYNSSYSLALAAFEPDNEYAVVSKTLSDGKADVVIQNVSPDIESVEICVINRLRQRILTIASMSVSASSGERVTFEAGDVDASPFHAIQTGIFATTCAQCHGATGTAAASLNLLPEEAYAMLVDHPSTVVEGCLRVKPGDAPASTLWMAVGTSVSDSWAFPHSNLLTPEKSGFIESWIDKGAKK